MRTADWNGLVGLNNLLMGLYHSQLQQPQWLNSPPGKVLEDIRGANSREYGVRLK